MTHTSKIANRLTSSSPPADSGVVPPRASILMVDDNPARLLTYEAVLNGLEIECVRAHSGAEALEKLLAQEFAAILLDVNMPVMDGFELARLVRQHPRMERTPIVFITGVNVTELDRLKGYEVGAIDYLSVPVVPEILRSKVAVLVELHQRHRELQALNRALAESRKRLAVEHATALAEREVHRHAAFEHPAEVTVVLEAERSGAGLITDWVYRDANTNALHLLGFTRETLIGRRLSEMAQERTTPTAESCARVLETGEPTRYESRFAEKDFLITIFSTGHDSVVSSGIDITERKRTETTLRESAERFRELANNIDQFAWTCKELGYATWYNDRWYEYTGTTFEETQGDGWRKVQDPAHVDRVTAHIKQCVAEGQPWEDTFPLRGKDGQYRWFLSRAVPIRDANGRIIRWFGTNTDVTELRRLQETLKETDRRKDEFLAMLAHELRNPIAPICNAAEALSRLVADREKERSLVAMVQRQSGHLARLLDDLLDVARVTQGRINLQREVINVSACVDLAIEIVEPLIREKAHQLSVTQINQPLRVSGDKVRLAQCVTNILTNAAKFTDAGGQIRVRIYAEGGEAVIEVADAGSGIAEAFLPRVFDLFAQSERSLDRSQGGLGIGLSTCRQLIQMHGGSVVAQSAGLGQGATFLIRLPRIDGSATTEQAATKTANTRRRVLLVDDNHDAADALAISLQLAGHETRTAYGPEDAIEQAIAFEPHFVLLDIGLPRMDGYEVGRRIKAANASVRLIALTGYGQKEDKQRSAAAGFEIHLVKPVETAALERALASELDR